MITDALSIIRPGKIERNCEGKHGEQVGYEHTPKIPPLDGPKIEYEQSLLGPVRAEEVQEGINEEYRVDKNVEDKPWYRHEDEIPSRYSNLIR